MMIVDLGHTTELLLSLGHGIYEFNYAVRYAALHTD